MMSSRSRYTKLYHSIWSDDDYRGLSSDAKLLYVLLISQPDITTCGVLPLTPRRWAKLLPDRSVDEVTVAMADLVAGDFVIVDEDTEELWVRSFIVHDGLHAVPNGRKSIERSMSEVLSQPIQAGISTVYGTLIGRVPETVNETVGPLPHPHLHTSPSPSSVATGADTPRFDRALDAIVEMRTRAGIRTNPAAYAKKVRANFDAEDTRRLAWLLDQCPNVGPQIIAERFEAGIGTSARPTVTEF